MTTHLPPLSRLTRIQLARLGYNFNLRLGSRLGRPMGLTAKIILSAHFAFFFFKIIALFMWSLIELGIEVGIE